MEFRFFMRKDLNCDMRADQNRIEISPRLRRTAWLLIGCGAFLIVQPVLTGAEDPGVVAVSSKASSDYIRKKLPDGSFEPERYAFGEGGRWNGPMRDDSIDKLSFLNVARTVAVSLAARSYLPARKPDATKLLIMVYWGTTSGSMDFAPSDSYFIQAGRASPVPAAPSGMKLGMGPMGSAPQMYSGLSDSGLMMMLMSNWLRDRINMRNAGILGYDSALQAMEPLKFTAAHVHRQDLIDDVEYNRYFVVLMAYDFQLMWKQKKHKLLWETRFSIREHRNDFDKQLPAMVQYAARYFGQDSNGLVRKPLPKER